MKKTAVFSLTLLLLTLLTGCAAAQKEQEEPMKLVLWHYYNDTQKEPLDRLIREYNETAGKKAGISVEAYSQGSITELSSKMEVILNHTTNDVGRADMFLAYRDITSEILRNNPQALVDYRDYMPKEQLAFYHSSYLKEGDFDGRLYILPAAKSTELLLMNQTRVDAFWEANPDCDAQDLNTWEGLERTAEAYYQWTDAMTPETENDGEAFIGMDVQANFFITQNQALDCTIYEYDENGALRFTLDREILGGMIDTFYEPYTKGYYGSYGKYRSDDLRQSLLAGYIGSSSSVSYFPKSAVRTQADGTSVETPIELGVYPYPYHEGGRKVAIQQGAGIVTVAGDERREAACIHFLTWLTQERGMDYAASLSYIPAGQSDEKSIGDYVFENENIRQSVTVGMQQSREYSMVYGFDFPNAYAVRDDLTDFFNGFLEDGREEYLSYLAQGMSAGEAAERMDYAGKKELFCEGIEQIFDAEGVQENR